MTPEQEIRDLYNWLGREGFSVHGGASLRDVVKDYAFDQRREADTAARRRRKKETLVALFGPQAWKSDFKVP